MLLPGRTTSRRARTGSVLPRRRLMVLAAMGGLILLARTQTLTFGVPQAAARGGGGEISEAAAQNLANKMAALSSPTLHSPASWGPVGVTEAEANSYLKYRGYQFLPPAVHNPEIQIAADHLSSAAEVDFNELGQIGAETDDWGMRVLSWVFRGKQRVVATGKLQTGDGRATLAIEGLTVGTTTIPAGFVNFLVQSYLEKRYGIDLSKPFALPPHVTHIELGAGRAVFHRSRT